MVTRIHRVVLAATASFLPACFQNGSPGLPLTVTVLASDKICLWEEPYDVEEGERHMHDLVAQAIVVRNPNLETVAVDSVGLELFDGSLSVLTQSLYEADLETGIAYTAELQRLGLGRSMAATFGYEVGNAEPRELSADSSLESGETLVFPNARLFSPHRPDSMQVTVRGTTRDDRPAIGYASVPVERCTTKNVYSFPVRGRWYLTGAPELLKDPHRYNRGTQFAIDLIKLGPLGQVWEGDVRDKGSFFGYGEPVFAAADGVVVRVNSDAVQTWEHIQPAEGEAEEAFEARRLAEKIAAVQGDHRRLVSGNYIVLEHANGEYSSYHHLKEGGVLVTPSDEVLRGQQIGAVGNTGDGFLVHLHFQVSDGPEEDSRSLPFRFENVEVRPWTPGYLVRPTVDGSP